MPIIIAGTIDLPPEKRDEALEAGKPLMEPVRAWKGCLDYVWSADPLTPGRIYVFERWETTEDLAAHLEGPHYLAMRNSMGGFGLLGVDVSKFEVARQEPVYDPTGKARADFFTDA